MNFSEIKELVELFDAGSIRELDLKNDAFSLYLNKNEMSRQTVSEVVAAPAPISETVATPVAAPVATQDVKAEEVSAPVSASAGQEVTSPIVGVIYTSSEPKAPNFVSVGDTVKVGDTLCIVEAMKIMNEIKSDVAGVVTEILIENEAVVEFGQPLFRIA